ncbi:MAG: sulfotransferase, partial [Desulfobulbaceae bacterium]|nr:sulfotransferase [Desulfobulbaceae bacterium]
MAIFNMLMRRFLMTIKRNHPCPCGSSKRYKSCCAILPKASPVPKEEKACSLVDQGNSMLVEENHEEALKLYLEALVIYPEYARAHYNIGVVLEKTGAKEKAVVSFLRALSFDPEDGNAHYNIGVIRQEQGEEAEAATCFQKAISIKPDYAEAHYNLGVIYKNQGEFEEALRCCQKALLITPDYAKSHFLISSLQKYSGDEGHISEMESLFSQDHINDEKKMYLAFGLGKAYEDSGMHEKAFYYLKEGNKLKRKSYEYSVDETEAEFKRIKRTFTKSFIRSNSELGNPDNTPIFILGMPRSGTSLVEQILASHPNIYGAGELPFIANIISQLSLGGQTEKICATISKDGREFIIRLGRDYIAEIRKFSAEAKFITDKMPLNFMWIGAIILALPNAKIISCLRDPMDNCLSIYKNIFHEGHKYAYDLKELGRFHMLYQDLMRYWHEVLPGKIYDISYERLVHNQEVETRDLLNHCGLPWDDACLSFHKTSRIVATASA